MSKVFDADVILGEPRILKLKGKEYQVPDIKMGTAILFQKIEQEKKDFSLEMIIDLIYFTLKDDNEITREEVENWGAQLCIKFTEWVLEPLKELKAGSSDTSKKKEKSS